MLLFLSQSDLRAEQAVRKQNMTYNTKAKRKIYVTCGSHTNNVCVFKDLVVLLPSNIFQFIHFLIKHFLEIRDSLVTTLTRIQHPSAVQTPSVFLREVPQILDLKGNIQHSIRETNRCTSCWP